MYRMPCLYIWSNYSDLTRPHPNWWSRKGNPLISGKSRLVKYYDLARYIEMVQDFVHQRYSPGQSLETYSNGTVAFPCALESLNSAGFMIFHT